MGVTQRNSCSHPLDPPHPGLRLDSHIEIERENARMRAGCLSHHYLFATVHFMSASLPRVTFLT